MTLLSVLILFGTLILPTSECRASNSNPTGNSLYDSVIYSLNFRQGSDMLLKEYRSNAATLDSMTAVFSAKNIARISKITIIGGTSHEGSVERNEQLAQHRAEAVRSYIIWRWRLTDKDAVQIIKQSDYLSAWVEAVESTDVPRKERVQPF